MRISLSVFSTSPTPPKFTQPAYLPHNFLTSPSNVSPVSSICAVAWTPLRWGQLQNMVDLLETKLLKETAPPPSSKYQFQISPRIGVAYLSTPPLLCTGIVWIDLVQVLCLLSQLREFIHATALLCFKNTACVTLLLMDFL